MRAVWLSGFAALALMLVPIAAADSGFETPPVPNDGQPGSYVVAFASNLSCDLLRPWSTGELAPPSDIRRALRPAVFLSIIDVVNACSQSVEYSVLFVLGLDFSSVEHVRILVLPGVDTTLERPELMTLGIWGNLAVGFGSAFPPAPSPDFILGPEGLTPG